MPRMTTATVKLLRALADRPDGDYEFTTVGRQKLYEREIL